MAKAFSKKLARRLLCPLALAVVQLAAPHRSPARTLEDALVGTFPTNLQGDPRGFARNFSRAVAAALPVTGSSASYVYRFDPATDVHERLSVPLGPVFSERAQTVGTHQLSLGIDYALVQFNAADGTDLAQLVSNDPRTRTDHIAVCAGLLCEPVLGTARLDVETQIVALSATYGITSDLDLNILLPLVRTFLRSSTEFTGPDPRVPTNPRFFNFRFGATTSETSAGVGDLLLRAKYVLTHDGPADVAAGMALSLPTGERADFRGTGDTLVGVALYASRTYVERIEPHANLSFVFNADKLDRSQARYSVGADTRVFDWLTLNADVLGRSDVAEADTVAQPVFPQIGRSDVLQFSAGFKVAPLARVASFFNVLLPLNNDGLRSDRILVFGLEAVF